MAVDTRAKRASVLGLALAPLIALPPPATSGLSDAERVGVTYCYAGTDFSNVSGTIAQTIDGFSQSSTGVVEVGGAIASVIDGFSQSATGELVNSGTADNVINGFSQSASGGVDVQATVANIIDGFSQSATGENGEVVADTAATGGGRGRKSVSKYPRRVVIGGVVYWVNSAAEERRLLLEYREKVEAEALELAITDAPAKEVAKARVKVVRAARRLEQVDTREADWLEYLRQEDDEIVSIVLH